MKTNGLVNLVSKEDVKNIFLEFHESKLIKGDRELDEILGTRSKDNEKDIDRDWLISEYGMEQYLYEGTPYDYIRYIIHKLKPKQEEVIYDLGSGYGRLVLYGALTTRATYRGVEIVPERVLAAERAKNNLGLRNAEFYQGNVVDLDISGGDIYFLFNPFFHETLESVGKKLKDIAQKGKIKIITWGGASNEFFEEQEWLNLASNKNFAYNKIQFFESL
jgi:SAM-dependent methyltransferase